MTKSEKEKFDAMYTALCGNKEGAKGIVQEFKEEMTGMRESFSEHQKEDRKLFNGISDEFKTNSKEREESKMHVIGKMDTLRKEVHQMLQPVVDYQQDQKTIFGFATKTVWIIIGFAGFLTTTIIAILK